MKKRITSLALIIMIGIAVLAIFASCGGKHTDQTETFVDESISNSSVSENNQSQETIGDNELVPIIEEKEPSFVIDTIKYDNAKLKYPVDVYVENNPGIASIAFTLHYDKTKLKLIGFEFNSDIGGQSVPFNSDVSETKLVWLNWDGNVNGDWRFATLYFEILDNEIEKHNISLTYAPDDIYNAHEENIAFRVIEGGIEKHN